MQDCVCNMNTGISIGNIINNMSNRKKTGILWGREAWNVRKQSEETQYFDRETTTHLDPLSSVVLYCSTTHPTLVSSLHEHTHATVSSFALFFFLSIREALVASLSFHTCKTRRHTKAVIYNIVVLSLSRRFFFLFSCLLRPALFTHLLWASFHDSTHFQVWDNDRASDPRMSRPRPHTQTIIHRHHRLPDGAPLTRRPAVLPQIRCATIVRTASQQWIQVTNTRCQVRSLVLSSLVFCVLVKVVFP